MVIKAFHGMNETVLNLMMLRSLALMLHAGPAQHWTAHRGWVAAVRSGCHQAVGVSSQSEYR